MSEFPPSEPTFVSPVRCHLGEGAAYEVETNTAWWFDILERRLYEADLSSRDVVVHDLPTMASALAVIDAQRLLISAEDGLHLRDRRDGTMSRLHPADPGPVATRSNDARVHPSGTLWFSSMGRFAEEGAGAIYALHAGRISRLFPSITIPNAICFSADGALGFFADTARHVLHRVPLVPETGLPAGEPVVIHHHGRDGGLDGAVVDSEGLIWIARWGAARLDAFTMAGDVVRSIPAPALQVSCPVFVGRSFDRLLVTSALEGMSARKQAEDPDGGKTFLVDVGTTGRPEPRLRL